MNPPPPPPPPRPTKPPPTTPTQKKPNVVAIGGGHGLAATLQAAKRYAGHVTAIVSVADDGGSSGRLREALGIPAPGDLRKCLVALAPPDHTMARAFEHRFDAGELDGHALGNLVIAALTAVTKDFVAALDEAGRLIGVGGQGRVLPATTMPVVLKAEAASGSVEGQVNVSTTGRISHVCLVPPDPPAPRDAIEAIRDADQVVIGPGSLFTSLLAAVVVPGIRDALAETDAIKVYVANLRPQVPETAGYDVAAHVDALIAHGVDVDLVLCDERGADLGAERGMPLGEVAARTVVATLANEDRTAHDPAQLATALADLVG
ncbi:MAG: hypothetical protein QOK43_2864 [Acidimicrobiaceae bacterium]|nr:hypothetical protein [Acidimicrobiaceae bacterium]